ncbi:MAG: hypothetical protein ACRDPM_26310, partial [Solirubrobacteraceae bacterium]
MTEHQSSRTLVKSAPELWAECSDAASLARHLGAFGEIRITKLEPETAVAWEGAAASGTVKLETAGWGTRVTLTVKEEGRPAAPDPEPEPVPEEPEPVAEAAEPEPEPVSEPEPAAIEPEPVDVTAETVRRARRFAKFRLAFRRKSAPVIGSDAAEPDAADPEPVVQAPPEPEPEPAEPDPE